MAHGQPDFGMYAPKNTVGSISDMGELAVRLGSIDSYDRRGDVVFLDDFEGTVLRWKKVVTGVETIALDGSSVRSGIQSVKIHCGAVIGSTPQLQKSFFSLGLSRLGAEAHISLIENTYTFEMFLAHFDGVTYHEGRLFYNNGTGKLHVRLRTPDTYLVASGLLFPSLAHCSIPIKLVIDFATDKYVRLLFGGVEYDISNIGLGTSLDNTVPQEWVRIDIEGDNTATAANLWVDDFILTRSEP